MSDSPKYNDDSSPFSTQESLTSLPRVCAPRFPAFSELVHPRTFILSAAVETAPSSAEVASTSRPVGLFEGLLQGHAELLAADVEEHPEKYDDEAPALVRAIVEKRKDTGSLTVQEREVLDRATLDFATYIPPKPKAAPSARRAPARAKPKDDAEDAVPVPGKDTPPEAEAPAYWWLR